jgi:hypothetical protein
MSDPRHAVALQLFCSDILRRTTTANEMATHRNDVKLIPGTEIMNDDGSAKKTLVPTPSSDPRDPLNWSRQWKRTSSTAITASLTDMPRSYGDGLAMAVHMDFRHGRTLNRTHVPSPGRAIPSQQQPARHADRHHRHHPRLRELHHCASLQYWCSRS